MLVMCARMIAPRPVITGIADMFACADLHRKTNGVQWEWPKSSEGSGACWLFGAGGGGAAGK